MPHMGKWAQALRALCNDLQDRFVSDAEFVERIWEAFEMFAMQYDRQLGEDHLYFDIQCRWKTRPNLNSTAAEFEWLANGANSVTKRFFNSRYFCKAMALLREQYRNMDPGLARDLNYLAHHGLR